MENNLNELINLTLDSWAGIANRDTQSIQLLHRTYRELFNENVQTGCGNCNQKAFLRIRQYYYNIKNNTTMANKKYEGRKFVLKEGTVLDKGFGAEVYTNDNLTDERAAQLIKENPNYKSHFSRLGSDEDVEEVLKNGTRVETDLPVKSHAVREEDREQAEKLLVDKTEKLPTTATPEETETNGALKVEIVKDSNKDSKSNKK